MSDASQLREIARELKLLLESSPSDKAPLPIWYAESQRFVSRLNHEFGEIDLPEEVWHFLHDADLRVKKPQLRAEQSEMIAEIIADLERGVVPESRIASVPVSPRALLLVAFAVLCAIALWIAL